MKTRKNVIRPKIHVINGYKLLFAQRCNDILHVQCVIRNGFCTETKENSGINHLLENVLIEGWKKCNAKCNSYWDNKGYYVNASTDKTTMVYYIKGLNTEWQEMVNYITTIINNPILTEESIKKEKQAVIDELLTYSNDPEQKLVSTFNHAFYKTEGLKYSDDWKLQIENLKKISLDDIYSIFKQYYTTQNMLFIVMGDFNPTKMKKTLQQNLTMPKYSPLMQVDCFTYVHDIIFVKQNIENTKVHIGFPYSQKYDFVHVDSCVRLLRNLFFNEFRTKKSLLYGIDINEEINACGTTLFIEFDTQTENALTVIKLLFKYIRHLQKNPLHDIVGFKNQEIYNYITNKKSMMTYYSSLIYNNDTLYTKDEIINKIRKISSMDIMKLMQQLFNIDKALCVYQSKTDLQLTWEKLI
jgi:predicted Zn-dependent peptidase